MLSKIKFLLLFTLFVNKCFSQPGVNKNVVLTLKVIDVNSKHCIIPKLKVLLDTQEIQVRKEIRYSNEQFLNADCRFILKKVINKKLVNMYVEGLHFPFEGPLRKFTTRDSLTDTICLEDFISLEPGQYVIMLEFNYYRNGVEDVVYSDDSIFFVSPRKTLDSRLTKRHNLKKK